VSLGNVSESKTKWTRAATDFRNYQIAKKNKSPGENLGIALKINKWKFLKRNSMQQNYIYNIPLPRGPGPKTTQKDNECGTNYPGVN
jgi:hypothetical protein